MYRYEFAKRRNAKNFKITCPSCRQRNKFNLYWDNFKQELAPDIYGKCDRVDSCGYINRPENDDDDVEISANNLPKPINLPTTFIDREDLVEYSKTRYKDPFSIWLIEKFGKRAKKVLDEYAVYSMEITTWNCYAPLFLYVDEQGNCRSGKTMRYEIVGNEPKRTKHEDSWDNQKWLHTWKDSYVYEQIAFGSHLLKKYPNKPIGIVESEKSSLIMSCVRPNILWLATMAYTGLQVEYLPNLKERDVTLFPDKGEKTLTYWKEKCEEFIAENFAVLIKCDTFIEQSELPDGSDLADYVIKKLK